MRTLAFWLLMVISVSAGFAGSRFVGFSQWSVALLSAGVLLAGLASFGAGVSRWGGRALAGPLLSFALVRGLVVGAAEDPVDLAAARGVAPRVRTVWVAGPSVSGPRCWVDAYTERGVRLPLDLPPELCPLQPGQAVSFVGGLADGRRVSPEPRSRYRVEIAWRRDAPRASEKTALQSTWETAVGRLRAFGWATARGDPGLGFVMAASLGQPRMLAPEPRAQLRRAGLGHLIAVSGLHVGIAAWLLLAALRWLLAPWWWGPACACACAAVPVTVFVALTGAAAPAVRAAVMLGVVSLGEIVGRPVHGPTTLAMAAAMMLFACPAWIVEPGFHLSFVAMMVLIAQPADASTARTSWHLSWALLPLLWVHFDVGADGSVLANAVGMPLFELWIVPTALVGWACTSWLGADALLPAAWGARLLLDVAGVVASLPPCPRWLWVAGALAVWWPALRRRVSARWQPWIPARAAAVAVVLAAAVSARGPAPKPGWTAWSGSRVPEVLAVDQDGRACVRSPSSSAARWATRLRAQGARALAATAGLPLSDPHHAALLAALAEHVEAGHAQPRCELPSSDAVRHALQRCAAFSSSPTARMRAPDDALECWSARTGAWRPASI